MMGSKACVLEARTETDEYNFSIRGWSLLSIDVPFSVGQHLSSPMFQLLGSKWLLSIYPGGDKNENKDYLSLWIKNCGESDVRVTFDAQLCGAEIMKSTSSPKKGRALWTA